MTREREVFHGVQHSLLDRYERRALCPRLPLVIAKPRRARFSPFHPPTTLLSSSPSSGQPPLRLRLYPDHLADHPSPFNSLSLRFILPLPVQSIFSPLLSSLPFLSYSNSLLTTLSLCFLFLCSPFPFFSLFLF